MHLNWSESTEKKHSAYLNIFESEIICIYKQVGEKYRFQTQYNKIKISKIPVVDGLNFHHEYSTLQSTSNQ